MGHIKVQIYEIQEPGEAEAMMALGVHRIGSVLVSPDNWKVPGIRDTIRCVKSFKGQSSLIPLFSETELIFKTIDWYEPDIIHFCESLSSEDGVSGICADLLRMQEQVKKRFPDIVIQRSIPIGETGKADRVPTLELARIFQSASDQFLTDTVVFSPSGGDTEQPVSGFVGITGKTCDWDMARKLVVQSSLPVILAGGLSPDNVYDAVIKTRPYGVDSCTQTNAVDGDGRAIRFCKDPEKVRRFVEETLRAERTLSDRPYETEDG